MMDAERRPGIFSRRQFLARNAWIVGLAVAAIAQNLLPFSTGEVMNVDGGFHLRRL